MGNNIHGFIKSWLPQSETLFFTFLSIYEFSTYLSLFLSFIPLSSSDHLKTEVELAQEKHILNEMLEVVEQRDSLVALLEEQRLSEKEEDKDLESVMLSKGFNLNWAWRGEAKLTIHRNSDNTLPLLCVRAQWRPNPRSHAWSQITQQRMCAEWSCPITAPLLEQSIMFTYLPCHQPGIITSSDISLHYQITVGGPTTAWTFSELQKFFWSGSPEWGTIFYYLF